MLCFDAALANVLSRDHAYDIIAFDFKKAFDKAPHHHVLEALRKLGAFDTTLKWFFIALIRAYSAGACWQQLIKNL